MTSTLDWADPYGNPTVGVDHLGLRVAGENAYAELVDFTVVATYRPRYLSYLCWALRYAWHLHAEQDEEGYLIDVDAWSRTVKGVDFAYCAANIAADFGGQRIVGSREMRRLLRTEPAAIDNTRNHVGGSGSLDTYAGVLGALGMASGHQQVSRAAAWTNRLADRFEEALTPQGIELLRGEVLPLNELRSLGERMGVTHLVDAASTDAAVATELEELRRAIVPLDRVDVPVIQRRLGTIGLLLRVHEQLAGHVGVSDFRSAVLDRVVLRDEGAKLLRLSESYEAVLDKWRWYQVRAYATQAIETLFSSVLATAWVDGLGVPVAGLISDVVAAAREESSTDRLPGDLRGLLSGSAGALISQLEDRIAAGQRELWMEPELSRLVLQGQHDAGETIYASFLLLLMALARMRVLRERDGLDGWLGGTDPRRLPPQELLRRVDGWIEERVPVEQAAGDVLRDLVIRQHSRNAFRKLEADPSRDTSRFVLDGDRLIVHNLHPQPASSYPRYRNAVAFLHDLRYIGDDGQPTSDGKTLAAAIEEALA